MISGEFARLSILVMGILFPAYASYKALRCRSGEDNLKWMMYWIVITLFKTFEVFADVFLVWLPFYYELKVVFVFWLLSAQRSCQLYKRFIHPMLMRREEEFEDYIKEIQRRGSCLLWQIRSRSLTLINDRMRNNALSRIFDTINELTACNNENQVTARPSQGTQRSKSCSALYDYLHEAGALSPETINQRE